MHCFADLTSAIANASIAIATWVLVWLAFRGLTAWRGNVQAAEELERKRVARKLHIALNRVVKEIMAIRAGKVAPSEVESGINDFGAQGYKPQPAAYYVSALDRLSHNIWCCWDDALLFLPQEVFSDLKRFCQTVSVFRESFVEYRCSGSVVATSLLTSRDEHALRVDKLRITVFKQEGEDPFQQRLMSDLEAVIRRLSPFIGSEVTQTSQ